VRARLTPPADLVGAAFTHTVKARFAETDAMGVIHHAAFLPWLEESRVAWLRHAGHPYQDVRASGHDLAVIEVALRYRRPVRFDDVVTIGLVLGCVTEATFQVAYLLRRDSDTVAEGVTVHASLDPASGRPRRLPAWLGDMARAAPSTPERS
jgi:acyl-CoA thioester hydrolase